MKLSWIKTTYNGIINIIEIKICNDRNYGWILIYLSNKIVMNIIIIIKS